MSPDTQTTSTGLELVVDVGPVALALCTLARDRRARSDGGRWWPA